MKNKYSLSIVGIILILAMICSFLALPVSAAAEAEATALAKIDPALLEKMETASPNEKISVAIWYKDIDQDNVDKLTVDKVGFTQDDIALTYEMPSTELINDLEDGEEGAADEMQAYLKRTEAKREKERKRTNEYIMTRRELSREKYNEKSSRIVKDIAIEEKDITFKSQYAPMIIAELTIVEIEAYSKNTNVTNIYYENSEEIAIADSILYHVDDAQKTIRYDEAIESLSTTDDPLNGSGVVVGVIEKDGNPQEHEELENVTITKLSPNEDVDGHATRVCRLIAGQDIGFAKGVSIVSSDISKSTIEEMLDPQYNVTIINASCSIGEYTYGSTCKWYDHIVSKHNVTIVASACNNDDGFKLYAPGLCYNTIMVGAYYLGTDSDDTPIYNEELNDDRVTPITGYVNTGSAEKPDVMMPGTYTSHATPILTGCIALILQLKPSLAAYPQAIKAIVLASCHRKVLPAREGEDESIYDGITEHQGAGAPDIWSMMAIVCQGTYGVGIIDSSTTQKTIRFTQPSYGATNMNISLTWLKNNSYEEGESHTNSSLLDEGENVNLNMYVYRNGSLLKSSTLSNSSTEMTYFTLNSSYLDYEVRINKISTTTEDVRYGFAYSTDNMLMTEETNEGVYRLKNLETDTYLTLDASTGELKHQSYADSSIQEWIVRQSAGCQISSAYGNTQGIINRSSTALNTNNYKAVIGNNTLNFSMLKWYNNPTLGNKGGVVLYSYIVGTQIFLDYYSNYVTFSSGTSNSTDSKIWMLEKVNYVRGDTNADGSYNAKDATLIQKYLSNTETLNNLQLFLADANYDGSVTIQDSTYIQKQILNEQ